MKDFLNSVVAKGQLVMLRSRPMADSRLWLYAKFIWNCIVQRLSAAAPEIKRDAGSSKTIDSRVPQQSRAASRRRR